MPPAYFERTASCLILTVIIFSVPGGGGFGWCDVAGKLPLRGVLLIWIVVEQGPTAVAVGAGGGCFGHFFSLLSFLFSFFSIFGRRPILPEIASKGR